VDIAYIALMIPFAGIALGAFGIWAGHKQEMIKKQAEIEASRAKQNAGANHELEQRLRVLERIITDKGYDVSQQIEDLRDETKKLEEMN